MPADCRFCGDTQTVPGPEVPCPRCVPTKPSQAPVERRHTETARAVLKRQFGNWEEDIPLVAKALADAEQRGAAKAVEPFTLLLDWESEPCNCRSVSHVRTEEGKFSSRAHRYGGTHAVGPYWYGTGDTLADAARDLCIKLGLLPKPGNPNDSEVG